MPYAQMTDRARLAHKLRDGRYRAKRLGCAAELVTIAQAEASGLLAQTTCYLCGCQLEEMYALEHKTPLARGGAHSIDNIGKSCLPCNEAKHIQDELEYLAKLDLAS